MLTIFLLLELGGLQAPSSSNITKLTREKRQEEGNIEKRKLVFKIHLQSCHSFLGVKTPILLVDLRFCRLHHLVTPLSYIEREDKKKKKEKYLVKSRG